MFIVKPTRTLSKDTQDHKETERRYDQIIRNLGDARIRHASLVLVDTNITTLHDCENNNDSVLTAIQFIKSECDNQKDRDLLGSEETKLSDDKRKLNMTDANLREDIRLQKEKLEEEDVRLKVDKANVQKDRDQLRSEKTKLADATNKLNMEKAKLKEEITLQQKKLNEEETTLNESKANLKKNQDDMKKEEEKLEQKRLTVEEENLKLEVKLEQLEIKEKEKTLAEKKKHLNLKSVSQTKGRYAFLVANTYSINTLLQPLPGTEKSIETISTILELHGFKTQVLLDKDFGELAKEMETWKSNCSKDPNLGALLFYFCGHGGHLPFRSDNNLGDENSPIFYGSTGSISLGGDFILDNSNKKMFKSTIQKTICQVYNLKSFSVDNYLSAFISSMLLGHIFVLYNVRILPFHPG